MGYIYKTINAVNGKIYVGKSYASVNESLAYLGSGMLIRRAIRKYGIENFTKEIIISGIENIDILNKQEIYWIKMLDSTNKNIGYNITSGGDGGDTISKNPDRVNICRKIQESNKKTWSDLEKRQLRSKALIGDNNPFFGKRHSEETRRKISKKKKGQTVSNDVKRRISNTLIAKYNAGELVKVVSVEQRKKHSIWMQLNQPTRQAWVKEKIRNTVRGAGNPSAKHWVFESETGEKKEVIGRFKNTCKEMKLSYSIMRKILGKTRKLKFHRGWTVYEKLQEDLC